MLTWIDLEMTGLDPNHDQILEIASLITTDDLDIVATGPSIVIFQPEEHLSLMREPVISMHRKNGLTQEVRESTISLKEAETMTLGFVKENIPRPHISPICGNTVWMDRNFLRKYMPRLDSYLHYRCLDVSTIKELAQRWRGKDFTKNLPAKPEIHRADKDIMCSVEELRFYQQHFLA